MEYPMANSNPDVIVNLLSGGEETVEMFVLTQ